MFSQQVISDAFDIVKTGSRQPEIFQLVGLFEERVGADRLSDMIATIILPDILAYTKRINYFVETLAYNTANPNSPKNIQENAQNCILFLNELLSTKTVDTTKTDKYIK